MNFSLGESSDDGSGYAPTYYPGTASAQQADKVTVAIGDEVSGLVFSLVPTAPQRLPAPPWTRAAARWPARSLHYGAARRHFRRVDGWAIPGASRRNVHRQRRRARRLRPCRARHYTSQNAARKLAFAAVTVNGEDVSGVTLVGRRARSFAAVSSFDVAPPDRQDPAGRGRRHGDAARFLGRDDVRGWPGTRTPER